jgi:hypothetical protein
LIPHALVAVATESLRFVSTERLVVRNAPVYGTGLETSSGRVTLVGRGFFIPHALVAAATGSLRFVPAESRVVRAPIRGTSLETSSGRVTLVSRDFLIPRALVAAATGSLRFVPAESRVVIAVVKCARFDASVRVGALRHVELVHHALAVTATNARRVHVGAHRGVVRIVVGFTRVHDVRSAIFEIDAHAFVVHLSHARERGVATISDHLVRRRV